MKSSGEYIQDSLPGMVVDAERVSRWTRSAQEQHTLEWEQAREMYQGVVLGKTNELSVAIDSMIEETHEKGEHLIVYPYYEAARPLQPERFSVWPYVEPSYQFMKDVCGSTENMYEARGFHVGTTFWNTDEYEVEGVRGRFNHATICVSWQKRP